MVRLPLYYWPCKEWFSRAQQAKQIELFFPPKIPKASYYNRCWVAGRWYSVPLHKKSRSLDPQIFYGVRWHLHHLRSWQTLLGKSPYFYEWKPFLEDLYTSPPKDLFSLNWRILEELSKLFGWRISWIGVIEEKVSFPTPSESVLTYLLQGGWEEL